MASSNHLRSVWRIGIIMAVFAVGVGGLALGMSQPASSQTDLQLDSLQIDDVNRTVSGNVSDVSVSVSLDYQWTVPDATRRIVKLKAGTDPNALQTLTFASTQVTGSGSGSTTLSASLLEDTSLTAADFDPAYAEQTSTEIIVQAVIEVRRASGEAVTQTVTETVLITVHDDGTITAQIGGTGSVDLTVS